jgi:hypothetical protein
VPAQPEFYEISPRRPEPFSAQPTPPLSDEQETALLLGRWRPAEPVVLRQSSDRGPDSLGWGGSPALWIVSPAFCAALAETDCTGWNTAPAVILGEDNDSVVTSDHGLLVVQGRCGPIDYERSTPIPGSRTGRRGLYFELDSWDGSDVFVPANSTRVIYTKKAVDALRKHPVPALAYESTRETTVYMLGR